MLFDVKSVFCSETLLGRRKKYVAWCRKRKQKPHWESYPSAAAVLAIRKASMRRWKAVSQPMHGHFRQSHPSPALKFTRSRASCNKSSIALLQGRRCLWRLKESGRLVYFLWPWNQFSEMVVTRKSRSSWISWMDERWPNVAMSKCAKGPSKPLWRWAEHGCLLSMASTTHHNYTPGTGSAYQTAHGSGIDWNDPNIQQPKQHSILWEDMVKNHIFSGGTLNPYQIHCALPQDSF